jgi:uncharacterized membrane protein
MERFGAILKRMYLKWSILLSIGLAGVSFAALYYLVVNVWPDPNSLLGTPQLLFFIFVFVGLTSFTVPATAYLNYRFAKPGWLERDRTRLIRQGVWVGLFGVIVAYLQLIRALSLMITLFLLAAFVLIELFFLTRE